MSRQDTQSNEDKIIFANVEGGFVRIHTDRLHDVPLSLALAAPDLLEAAKLLDSWMRWPDCGPEVDYCAAWFRHHGIKTDELQPIDYIWSLFRAAITKATKV